MSDRSIGEKAGDKLEAGLRQAAASVKDLATHRGSRKRPDRTKAELYAEAVRMDVKGRSKMTKAELEKAVGRG